LIGSNSNMPVASADQPLPAAFAFAEEEEKSSGFTLMQIWCMVRAHLWVSIAICLLAIIPIFLVIKSLPKRYESTATLIVNVDNTDPLAGRSFVGQAFFSTQVELIYNDVMLQPVVERLKLKEDASFTGDFEGDQKALNDMVLQKLRDAINVRAGDGSTLLYISASSRSPQRAAEMANAVADEYMRQTKQRTNAPARERAGRYNEQLGELKKKVDDAQTKVAAFRARNGMTDPGQTNDMASAAVSDLETKLLQVQSARRQLEGLKSGNRADGVLAQETPEMASLRSKLEKLENDLGEARATMGLRHPKVVQLENEIATTHAAIQSSANRQLAQIGEFERKYQADLNAARSRLLDRRVLQDQGAKLLLEQRLAEESYAQALRGLDQVQFASQGNYQDVTLVSPAEPPSLPSRSNKRKLFIMMVVASFALAFGLPFGYELLLNRRIRCRDDLERGFRVVTLAQFGPVAAARGT